MLQKEGVFLLPQPFQPFELELRIKNGQVRQIQDQNQHPRKQVRFDLRFFQKKQPGNAHHRCKEQAKMVVVTTKRGGKHKAR